MTPKRCIPLVAAAVYLGSSAIVHGQAAPKGTTPAARASTPDDAAASRVRLRGPADQQRPAPADQPPANTIIERPGDSMLNLGNEAPDGPTAKTEGTGFFAVPVPQPKTLKKHDLVTIVIREQSDYTAKGTNNFDKKAELQAKLDQFVKLNVGNFGIYGLPPSQNPANIDISGERTFNGNGEVDRSDELNARIEAEIVDVKPNGTLVVQARKKIKQDTEEQEFILSGICRVEDVTADNTVLSTQLFDLDLVKNQKGDVREATKRGFLPKLLDFINPF